MATKMNDYGEMQHPSGRADANRMCKGKKKDH